MENGFHSFCQGRRPGMTAGGDQAEICATPTATISTTWELVGGAPRQQILKVGALAMGLLSSVGFALCLTTSELPRGSETSLRATLEQP